MRYKPIESRSDALDRIAGLGYDEFSIVSYEENWQREQGEPDIEITRDAEYAVDRFLTLCGRAVCVELRGIQPGGSETAPLHWGDRPGSERGREYIEWSKPEQGRIPSRVPAAGGADAAPEAAPGGFCLRSDGGEDAFVQMLKERTQELRHLRLQLAQARADSPKPRPWESELPPLFSAVLEKDGRTTPAGGAIPCPAVGGRNVVGDHHGTLLPRRVRSGRLYLSHRAGRPAFRGAAAGRRVPSAPQHRLSGLLCRISERLHLKKGEKRYVSSRSWRQVCLRQQAV